MSTKADDGNALSRARARLDLLVRVGVLLDGSQLDAPLLQRILAVLVDTWPGWAALVRVDREGLVLAPADAPDSVVTRLHALAAAPMSGPMQVLITGNPVRLVDDVTGQHLCAVPVGNAWRSVAVLLVGGGAALADDDVTVALDVGRRLGLGLFVDEARERAMTASRARDEFLAQLSHELRTPLTAMLGWARVLRSEGLDEEKRTRGLESLERGAMAQAQLVENLLEISRIITGRIKLNMQEVDLAQLASTVASSARQLAHARSVTLMMVAADVNARVVGDHDRLQTVLWNLVQNAIKFTPRGGMVTVEVQRLPTTVRVRVIDTGKGIPQDELPDVFDRFKQHQWQSGKPAAGLGLGLSVVRQLVELHRGTVRAESGGEDRGATFTVEIPALQ